VKSIKEVVFASQATLESGAGHLRRCIRFAQELPRDIQKYQIGKIEIEWLSSLNQATFSVLKNESERPNCSLVILDSYDKDFCEYIREKYLDDPIIQIADRFTPILEGVSILWLDFPDGTKFHKHEPEIIASGLKFMPISKISRGINKFEGAAKNVLVTTGGNPYVPAVELISRELSKSNYKDIEVHFLGNKPSFLSSQENIHYYKPGLILDELLEKVDTVITASGTSLWDFLANGFCVGAIKVVENQSRNFDYVSKTDQVVPICLDMGGKALGHSLRTLFFDLQVRKNLTLASSYYDFDGARRFAKIVELF
jgi:spore coat polysaccharide biosynthesis predicted glycosyltransferase SpsG